MKNLISSAWFGNGARWRDKDAEKVAILFLLEHLPASKVFIVSSNPSRSLTLIQRVCLGALDFGTLLLRWRGRRERCLRIGDGLAYNES